MKNLKKFKMEYKLSRSNKKEEYNSDIKNIKEDNVYVLQIDTMIDTNYIPRYTFCIL